MATKVPLGIMAQRLCTYSLLKMHKKQSGINEGMFVFPRT